MREKELRLALVCYGGISLAVYMHGVTKEIWHLARASRDAQDDETPAPDVSQTIYREIIDLIEERSGAALRILPDIIAGASAGGINGIFLAHALATGYSLEALTKLWLENADVDNLIDPDARPMSKMTKFWATPIAWMVLKRPGNVVSQTVSSGARTEVRSKLSRFVRARWLEPPFGGEVFTGMLLDAFSAMAAGPKGPRLISPGQPIDLFVTVTDFNGHKEILRLNSPAQVLETEHKMIFSFRDEEGLHQLDDSVALSFAARATASFPGAFPPFNVSEMDSVLTARSRAWSGRKAFLARIFPKQSAQEAEHAVLIDGSVLANAPFGPALAALKDRPARREIDRRFVYIDPKPGLKSVRLTKSGRQALPGFFGTIFGAMSDIPREQPIRDSLEAIEGRSSRIRRMQRIVDSLRPGVEQSIETLFGRTFFLDRPTPARLVAWRRKAHQRAAEDSGFAYAAYVHVKLSTVVEDMASLGTQITPGATLETLRQKLWSEVRAQGVDRIDAKSRLSDATVAFLRTHDLGFRIRRLRFCARTVVDLIQRGADPAPLEPVRDVLYQRLAPLLALQSANGYPSLSEGSGASILESFAAQRGLIAKDALADATLAEALAACPKAERRSILLAYLGFPYFDISTFPMLQGEGLDEFDPVKVDRISPEDATALRQGGTRATLKGIEFNSFGAFFSRAYRENDYLWGRLHGADRLVDILLSTCNPDAHPSQVEVLELKRRSFLAILDEEQPKLAAVPELFRSLRAEVAAMRGPPPKAGFA